jgi:hypothetical protein
MSGSLPTPSQIHLLVVPTWPWIAQCVLLPLLWQLFCLLLLSLLAHCIHFFILQAPQIHVTDLLPLHLYFVGSKCNEHLSCDIIFILKHCYFDIVIINDISAMCIALLVLCMPLFVSCEAWLHVEVWHCGWQLSSWFVYDGICSLNSGRWHIDTLNGSELREMVVQVGTLVEQLSFLCWCPDICVFEVEDNSASVETISYWRSPRPSEILEPQIAGGRDMEQCCMARWEDCYEQGMSI